MIPTAKVRAFGKLQLWDQNGNLVRLKTKKTESLLAILMIANGPKSRAELAESIWPDSPPEKARLSLRTAIAQLRKSLGPETITSHDERIEIERNLVESDLIQARRLHRLISISKDGTERRNYQEQLADLIIRPLFDGIPGDELDNERSIWHTTRKTTLLDLADARLASGMNESALTAATTALKIDRLDEKSLEKNLRILTYLGRTQDALKLSQDSARLFRKELSLPLPKSIIDLTTEIKTGNIAPGPQPHSFFTESIEKEMIVAMFESTIERDPDTVFTILCDESFNTIALENLSGYIGILEKALNQTTGNSEPRIRAARMVARTAMMMSDYSKCFEWGKVVVDNTEESSQIHIATLDFLASAYFNLQDYALAEELSIRAYDLAEEHGFPVERNSALGNLALYHIHQLKFDTVQEKCERCLRLILEENASPFRVCSVYSLLCGYHLAVENYEEAITIANKGIDVIGGSTYYLNGNNYCTKANALAKLGKPNEAIKAAIEGLSIGYAGNSFALTLGTLELCSLVLTTIGYPISSVWISDATNILREHHGFSRSRLILSKMADEVICPDQKILAQARATNRLNNQPLSTLVEFTLDELERALNGM